MARYIRAGFQDTYLESYLKPSLLGSNLTWEDAVRILGHNGTSGSARILRLRSEAGRGELDPLKRMPARISIILDKNGLHGNHVAAEYAGRLIRKVYKVAMGLLKLLRPHFRERL